MYQDCIYFRSNQWATIDRQNKANGLATNLQDGASTWVTATNCMVFATLFACLIPVALGVPMLLKRNPMNVVYFCVFMSGILWLGGLGLVARTDQLNPNVRSIE